MLFAKLKEDKQWSNHAYNKYLDYIGGILAELVEAELGKALPDSLKNQLEIRGRSGVCLILKAEIIRQFLDEVQIRMKSGVN